MQYRSLGRTGIEVSALALGTAELGVEGYDENEVHRPPRTAAIDLLLEAFEGGVTFIDTAPGDGECEAIVGEALRRWSKPVAVATNVASSTTPNEVRASIELSLQRLGRETLELVQLRNASGAELDGPVMETLVQLRQEERIRAIGASVNDPRDALAAVHHPEIVAVQLAFSLLDQRATAEVFPAAESRETALIAHSVLLKGVLTARRRDLPDHLGELVHAADRAERWARRNQLDLPTAALCFCLSQSELTSVLVGIRSRSELELALTAAATPTLPRHKLSDAGPLAVEDSALLDPRTWGLP